jgi:hypothetical protein
MGVPTGLVVEKLDRAAGELILVVGAVADEIADWYAARDCGEREARHLYLKFGGPHSGVSDVVPEPSAAQTVIVRRVPISKLIAARPFGVDDDLRAAA